ncbi:MAG: hypothetical protein HXY40_05600 [Chloroflexi bacterium]|nr:hypothetical protein [Chloroflexota bacterium]
MTDIVLSSTWLPRGELPRFERLHVRLAGLYAHMILVVPIDTEDAIVDTVYKFADVSVIRYGAPNDAGRHCALQMALETGLPHIHYCDFDRLLRWVELYEDELRQTVEALRAAEALMIGRTPYAFGTHPKCMQHSEALVNDVFSHLLGTKLDLTSGSKAFSRRAVEVLVNQTSPGNGMATDTEWPVVLQRAGFRLSALLVDGLDWETADRYLPQAADPETQRRAAEAYDANVENWHFRVRLAQDIIHLGLETLRR